MGTTAFTGTGKPLSEAGVLKAAGDVGIELPALWAVMTVETKGCGFLPDRRPQILFERHIFHKRTNGRFSATAPDVSNPSAGGYGPSGSRQYDRLQSAIKLNRNAALESTSWGLGQVMGFNAATVGYASVEDMVEAMCESEDAQFQAMIAFIVDNKLPKYLQSADWAKFAYYYNGPDFQKNKYDEKLAKAHARFIAGPLPSLKVRTAQLYLTYLGQTPGTVDGWFGINTQNALIKFQKAEGLPATGQIDDSVLAALEKAVAR
jgi:hypothetical protein